MLESQSSSSPRHSRALFFVIGAMVVIIILLILVIVLWRIMRPAELLKFIRRADRKKEYNDLLSGNLHTISHFDFQTLKKATKSFHPGNLLGRGGFGPVYRGKLDDGRLVAVKKLSLEKSHQGESEFLSEVRMITSIQHKNLVRLLGCCSDGPQRLLVYEYMKNRSLDIIVYDAICIHTSTNNIDLCSPFDIMQHMFENSDVIVWNYYVPSNFLVVTLLDFVLRGYTAPEYAIRGELSEKADIYSFGVLVLEIISCRKNTDLTLPSEMQYLPEYAWKLHERSRLTDLVDPRLREHGFVEKDVLLVIHVAFLCLQPHANLRPPMSQIVAMLTCKVETMGTPIMKPAFVDRRRKRNQKSSWDTISDVFPSPLRSDSSSLPRHLS
ncbi:hypothetical protein Tsubulata_031164 [Turnera subulata]|uniref:Protein kinase domain-containing protein n=1 Tax=Turnera subulata TaxID=218843 RepID=A0A9Q0FHE6_9ROSI|nr:hypothetical protein Tsubulata_031164 [Turnera subulata]